MAQVGRSLGVHLILSTQKPAGTVDDNIRSNCRFRLCLRVQDRQDSMEMLHRPDAAFLTQAGRCCLQVGNDEVFRIFQSGYCGAPLSSGLCSEKKVTACLLTQTGQAEVTDQQEIRVRDRTEVSERPETVREAKPGGKEKTQLEGIIEYLRETARRLSVRKIAGLWLPSLPKSLVIDELVKDPWPAGSGGSIRIGLADDPENQKQFPVCLSVPDCGHIAVCGAVGSGKSTFLQTVLYSLTRFCPPSALSIYLLESGSRHKALEMLPHCGGRVSYHDLEKTEHFFSMIRMFIKERKENFQGLSYTQYQKENGSAFPVVLVVMDDFAAFRERTEDAYEGDLSLLAREGAALGILLLIAAGGVNIRELPPRIHETCKTVFCLEMTDRFSYAEVLHTARTDVFPEQNIKGRGLFRHDGRILEFQTALCFSGEESRRQELLREYAKGRQKLFNGEKASEIPFIPDPFLAEDFFQREETRRAIETPGLFPIGCSKDSARVYCVPIRTTGGCLITGVKGTGRRSFLRLFSMVFSMKGGNVHFADSGNAEETIAFLKALQDNREHKDEPGRNTRFRGSLLAISDLPGFFGDLSQEKENLKLVESCFMNHEKNRLYIAAVLDPAEKGTLLGYGAYNTLISGKRGFHFGGNPGLTRLLNLDYLNYQEQNKILPPGIALVSSLSGNRISPVVVPYMGEEEKRI